MSKFSQSVNLSEKITMVLNGDFLLKIKPSPDGFDYINLINCKKENFSRRITPDLIEINVQEVNLEGQKYFDNFKSSIEKKQGIISSISSFISDAIEYKEFLEGEKINIELEILLSGGNEREISIISKNLSIEFGLVYVKSIKIESGNLDFQHGKLISKSTILKSGNLKGLTAFNPENKNIKISASNGRLIVDKKSEFNGLVECGGNNLKITGAPKNGDLNSGCFYAKLNNGKIIFNEN